MNPTDRTLVPGGLLVCDPAGHLAPFTFRDYASAFAFIQMHPKGTLTHFEDAKRWRILRRADGQRLNPSGQ